MTTSLRRYAPFALLVAAQIVLVVVAPSRGTTSGNGPLGGQFSGGGPGTAASPGALAPGAPGSTGATAGGAQSGPGTVPGTGTNTVGTTPGLALPATGATAGAPFCVTGLQEHNGCIARWAGGDNGGATSQGVTGSTITVVMYRNQDNAAVNAILRATGTYIDPAAERDMFELVTGWMNKHLQLYGRKIKPVYVRGTCEIAPSVDSCFRAEADSIVARYKPFAVVWDNDANQAAFPDELSRKGVINWGGWGFADKFSQELRPYHYDEFMGGDVQAEYAGAWYCRRLAGHKARFAGQATLRAKTRKVVVIYGDTAQTTPAARHLMQIIAGCAGSSAVIDGKYSSDTSTASQQATTDQAKFKAAGVTTALWFSDPIAPAYGTKAQASQNFYPEEVLAGSGLLDYDALAQTYDAGEWRHAFGPSDLGTIVPVTQTDAGLIWRAEGRSGSPNSNANLLTTYNLLAARGIMLAGPKLTPLTYEYGLLTAPGYDAYSQWHDPRLTYIKYGPGDYTGISDIREVYYDPSKRSVTNNRPGAYVPVSSGRRYLLGGIPTGEPSLPAGV